jgi:hypothetical protein
MFYDCIALINAPILPATDLADYCYSHMFNGCTSLTKAPELLAIKLAESCHAGMFKECTRLTEGPELPATKLAPQCYEGMFMNSGIKEMPVIKAKVKISNHSLYTVNMFKGTGL